ncbi:spore coat protein GerQ [Salinithrix halophila]|uniref:Spore coat protein GerQ n=1 Tax=Salinithrix halophila TaxID=1485204 RepID=A0ABV8JIB6_9BACL
MYWNQPGMAAYGGFTSQQQRTRYYSEDLMSRNIGKLITVYMTFENNPQWNAKVFTGVLRQVGRDFMLVRDQQTGKDTVLYNLDVDYIVFDNQPATLGHEE